MPTKTFVNPTIFSITPPPTPPGNPTSVWLANVARRGCGANGADALIAWSPVPGATSYRVSHPIKGLLGVTSNTQLWTSGWYQGYNPARLTITVQACNSAGCSSGTTAVLYIPGSSACSGY